MLLCDVCSHTHHGSFEAGFGARRTIPLSLAFYTLKIAGAFDSCLIGDAAKRADVESMLEMLSDNKKKEWRDQRQDRHRTSVSQIGEAAHDYSAKLRKNHDDKTPA